MRRLKTFVLLAFLLACAAAHAESVDPDLHRLLREAQQPKIQYGPARVGWNGAELPQAGKVWNPVYESLRVDSPAAIRREIKAVLLPPWQLLVAFVGLILGLRLIRSSQQTAVAEAAPNVVPFPSRPLPREEAA